ncbi:hypothetical protein ACOZ4I_03290 [Haloarcula salina]|uniref:hypothetical protein n=1 Tax=Haloarcula salina TaxID=1429914 RepID=UPI003C6F5720
MDGESGGTGSGTHRLGSLAAAVGWIGAGAIFVATVALVVQSVAGLGLTQEATVGLGLAMGGGLGGVSYLIATDDGESADETVTVSSDTDTTPDPQPADLFESHPDPVLYVADEGHGPVVRAANEAFGAAFDVPADRVGGTALSEALLVAGIDEVDAETVRDEDLDTVVLSTAPDEPTRFRLRTVGESATGYLLLTPIGGAAD